MVIRAIAASIFQRPLAAGRPNGADHGGVGEVTVDQSPRTGVQYRFIGALLSVFAVIAGFLPMTMRADAQERRHGPFTVRDSAPGIIELAGKLTPGSADDFRNLLQETRPAKMLVINSPGGSTNDAIEIARRIHDQELDTFIPKGARCEGTCALVFLAGRKRDAEGVLGVRRFRREEGRANPERVVDMLTDFDVPIGVKTSMLRTEADDLYVFSRQEINDYGLAGGRPEIVDDGEDLVVRQPGRDDDPPSPVRRRFAVYTGVDFFGGDFNETSVSGLRDCMRRCAGYGSRCRAFTFNTSTPLNRGPNCFLKSEKGLADGNAVAISGEFLEPDDPDPRPKTIGVIDPKQGLIKDYDYPGGDLFRYALRGVDTPLKCRLACVRNDDCRAFTFVKKNKSCWLKSTIVGGRRATGMVSGQKDFRRLVPQQFVPVR